jgi:hypothetical protein
VVEEEEGEGAMFMTEHPQPQPKHHTPSMDVDVHKGKHTYQEFKKLAFEILGDRKDYDVAPIANVDIKTAYKNLR